MKRSKQINKIISSIEALVAELQEIEDKEQEKFDAKSDKWQESDKGQDVNEYISSIQSAKDYLQNGLDELEEHYHM